MLNIDKLSTANDEHKAALVNIFKMDQTTVCEVKRELLPNSAVPLDFRECFSIFQLIVLVLTTSLV